MNFKPKAGIIDARRLPIGKVNGVLKDITPEQMFKSLIEGQFAKLAITKNKVDQVVLGNITNLGGNIARRCALDAGFSIETPAYTIDCQCGSALLAVISGVNLIQSGDAQIVCAGGVESSSNANLVVDRKTTKPLRRFKMTPMQYEDLDMGVAADYIAQKYNISREKQDLYAYKSQQKAVRAVETGEILPELVSFETENIKITKDQCVRMNTSLEALANLEPVFTNSGTCTAGNSCPINDGASSVILAEPDMKMDFQGYYLGQVTTGILPKDFLLAPIPATEKLLAKFGLTMEQIDAVELNEAFAVQGVIFQQHFKLADEKLNGFGGAIAFGHPYGATGGIVISRLLNRINHISRPALGIVTLCIAGGMGTSILLANKWWQNNGSSK